ncbi:hypothetical protein C1H46_026047 [Malus baccata]|uniref:Phytocyanin domain-containing protein n=1 Tax=Malus baccata TaxID=106549 RepID=A0A540LPR2_MALBA|nr:hypothetical protein C1H46_026047 [Malus baccata]
MVTNFLTFAVCHRGSNALVSTGALMNDINTSPELTAVTGRFPFEEILKLEKPGAENKDASDTEDDEEDGDDEELDEAKAATYIVGDQRGWTIPPYDNYYKIWASKHRVIKVNDILVFKFEYGKQNWAWVERHDYNVCNTTAVP